MVRQSHVAGILLTRPLVQSQRFSAELQGVLGGVEVCISPLMATELLDPEIPEGQFVAAIITSETGVIAAARLRDKSNLPWHVYCVGRRTEEAARRLGFDPAPAQSDAKSLIASLLAQPPHGPLVFLRGEDSAGDIESSLKVAGIETVSTVVYRQRSQPLSAAAAHFLQQPRAIVLPLFSPRSARLMSEALRAIDVKATLLVAAMSDAVALAARALEPAEIKVADRPESAAMIDAVDWFLRSGA